MKLITATYNIRHGYDVGFDWNRLAAHIREVKADLVGFQEVDMGTLRSGGRDSLAGLREATGFSYGFFVPAMDFNGGQYGTAILTRFPVISFDVYPLESGKYEPRSCGRAVLDLGGGRELVFLNTHLCYENAEARVPQFCQLASFLPADKPFLLTGDFNTEDVDEFAPLLRDRCAALVNGGTTWDGTPILCKTFRNPPMAIDNMVYAADTMTLLSAGMTDSADSDHNMLSASFEL